MAQTRGRTRKRKADDDQDYVDRPEPETEEPARKKAKATKSKAAPKSANGKAATAKSKDSKAKSGPAASKVTKPKPGGKQSTSAHGVKIRGAARSGVTTEGVDKTLPFKAASPEELEDLEGALIFFSAWFWLYQRKHDIDAIKFQDDELVDCAFTFFHYTFKIFNHIKLKKAIPSDLHASSDRAIVDALKVYYHFDDEVQSGRDPTIADVMASLQISWGDVRAADSEALGAAWIKFQQQYPATENTGSQFELRAEEDNSRFPDDLDNPELADSANTSHLQLPETQNNPEHKSTERQDLTVGVDAEVDLDDYLGDQLY